jgi:hypothetical protein
LLLQLVASQSANALEVKNSGGSTVFNLTPSGGFTAAGDSIFSLTGSSTGSPRKLQLTNVGSGTAFRMELESEGTGFQAREAGKLQIQARYGVKIVGTRNSTFAPSFESGATTDPALYLENGVTGAIPLRVNAISSTSTNLAEFQSNASTVFSLTTTGVLGVVAASDPGSPTNSDLWRSSSRNAISIRNSGQTVWQLDDGSAVKLTIASWLTPKKRQINEKGIPPDVTVAAGKDADHDLQMAKAKELLAR